MPFGTEHTKKLYSKIDIDIYQIQICQAQGHKIVEDQTNIA